MSDRSEPDAPIVVVTTAAELRKLTRPASANVHAPGPAVDPAITEHRARVGSCEVPYRAEAATRRVGLEDPAHLGAKMFNVA